MHEIKNGNHDNIEEGKNSYLEQVVLKIVHDNGHHKLFKNQGKNHLRSLKMVKMKKGKNEKW